MKNALSIFSSRVVLALVVVVFSVLYYAQFINTGFNFSDAGNYAQIAYELFLGRNPNELVIGYGILWFKVGEFLFHLVGVDYTFIKFFFYFCIVITNVLVFYVVHLTTGNRALSLTAAAVATLVPAFPPTSFYALCILLNVAAQIQIARGQLQLWNLALAGAVLSFTFQIRPDFGFVFAVPLFLILAIAALEGRGRWWKMVGSAFAGFFVVSMLGLIAAIVGDYGDAFLRIFAEYPVALLEYSLDGLRILFFGQEANDIPGREVLARPPIGGALFESAHTLQLALLIYSPILLLSAFTVLNVKLVFESGRGERFNVLAPSIVVFFAALAAFPHYFLYRPDISHIANFMPGYLVMLAVFVAQIFSFARTSMSSRKMLVSSVVVFVISVNLCVYLWVGLHSPGTGSIAGVGNKVEKFIAGNGVDVLVSPDEKSTLEFLRDIVVQNSAPGDTVICVPYCPGVAFMTERRMLLGNFYVDNAILVNHPNWVENAIDLTKKEKPAVIVVIDWAINGSEQSRFSNWAASYVSEIEALSRNTVVNGNITAYIL